MDNNSPQTQPNSIDNSKELKKAKRTKFWNKFIPITIFSVCGVAAVTGIALSCVQCSINSELRVSLDNSFFLIDNTIKNTKLVIYFNKSIDGNICEVEINSHNKEHPIIVLGENEQYQIIDNKCTLTISMQDMQKESIESKFDLTVKFKKDSKEISKSFNNLILKYNPPINNLIQKGGE